MKGFPCELIIDERQTGAAQSPLVSRTVAHLALCHFLEMETTKSLGKKRLVLRLGWRVRRRPVGKFVIRVTGKARRMVAEDAIVRISLPFGG